MISEKTVETERFYCCDFDPDANIEQSNCNSIGKERNSKMPFRSFIIKFYTCKLANPNGLITLPDSDFGDTDFDSKPDGYILLCRRSLHCMGSDLDPSSLFLYRTGMPVLNP